MQALLVSGYGMARGHPCKHTDVTHLPTIQPMLCLHWGLRAPLLPVPSTSGALRHLLGDGFLSESGNDRSAETLM